MSLPAACPAAAAGPGSPGPRVEAALSRGHGSARGRGHPGVSSRLGPPGLLPLTLRRLEGAPARLCRRDPCPAACGEHPRCPLAILGSSLRPRGSPCEGRRRCPGKVRVARRLRSGRWGGGPGRWGRGGAPGKTGRVECALQVADSGPFVRHLAKSVPGMKAWRSQALTRFKASGVMNDKSNLVI